MGQLYKSAVVLCNQCVFHTCNNLHQRRLGRQPRSHGQLAGVDIEPVACGPAAVLDEGRESVECQTWQSCS